jgi:NAD(P)-dependent dehydrogenase (short-subunit alcohol dehydrogenase family)
MATIVLTGASTGIGHATALIIAGQADHLVLHGLEPENAVAGALERVPARVTYLQADYDDLSQVSELADRIRAVTDRIDLLINNAARPGPPARTVNDAGFEVTYQVNYLAPVLLTSKLIDLIGPGGRIVNVASATHFSATLDLDDLDRGPRRYSPSAAYAHSKLALVAYSGWLAAHRPNPALEVVSMHPGVIATGLLHAMFSIAGDSPEHAAGTIAYVASRRDDNGTYYDEREPQAPNPQAADPEVQNRLHELTTASLAAALRS